MLSCSFQFSFKLGNGGFLLDPRGDGERLLEESLDPVS